MSLLDIFKSNSASKIVELESKVDELTSVITKSVTNQSLMAFNNGNVEWYNVGSNNSYSDHYTIYRGIDMLASLGAGLPYKLYRGDRELDLGERLTPGNFDFANPNPNMSLNEVMYTALVYFFYRGEFMVEMVDDPFFYLQPINPQHMTRLTNKVDWRYSYNGVNRTILDDNLIYVKLMNPDTGASGSLGIDRGLGPVDVVKADLENDKSAKLYNTNFFKNFGQIGGFFYDSEAKAKPEDMKNIVDQFDSIHKGSKKAYKTLGLPRGIRYEDFQKTMKEMQYLESQREISLRILAVLGIHKALFGVTDQVNRSVSEEATRMLWLHNLKPKMIRVQEKWNQKIFRSRFPIYTFSYDFSEISELKQGFEIITAQITRDRSLGYTTNEINEKYKLGYENITDPVGDMRFIPNSLVPADDLLISDAPITPVKNITNDTKKMLNHYLAIEDKGNRININKFKRNQKKLSRTVTKHMAGKLGKYFSIELGHVLKIILTEKAFKNSLDINSILAKIQNQLTLNKQFLQSTMEPLYKDGSLAADALALETLNISVEPVASEMVVASLSNKITNITNHTYRLVRSQIKDGVNAGDTIEEIANRVKNVYKMNASRARIIARTESGSVIHKTTDERYRKEKVQKKQWVATGDSETRDSHNDNDSMGVVDYDYVYPNGQTFPNDGGGSAGESINCRCTYVGII